MNVEFNGVLRPKHLPSVRRILRETGLEDGHVINNETTWLVFNLDGKVIAVATVPVVNYISQDKIKSLMGLNIEESDHSLRLTNLTSEEWDNTIAKVKDFDRRIAKQDVDEVLMTSFAKFNGSASWVEDVGVLRGYFGVDGIIENVPTTSTTKDYAWRPVFEFVTNDNEGI